MSVLKFVSRFVDVVMPMHCQVCDKVTNTDYELCDACKESLPWLVGGCEVCAMPLPPAADGLCGHCIANPKPYERLVSVFRYEAQIRDMVLQMKFSDKLATTRLLGELVAEALPYYLDKPDVLLPIPLHVSRMRERGYNQSLELAKQVAKLWGVPLEPQWVRRVVNTDTQSMLSGVARARNIRGAFKVGHSMEGARVLILDDVVTTGATVEEMAKVLRKAGAASVEVACVARSV